ncbi:hypothetical protein L596_005584 [Steinernema carpocapsae]|uniref:Uncharacterized protein n=1 Tax=Steinernema carpocapsae TaxID=34508 RepID=A0A4U8V0P6_STECR|nr:hypothetical protein L596_005584 [Steinernema carpocapsae]
MYTFSSMCSTLRSLFEVPNVTIIRLVFLKPNEKKALPSKNISRFIYFLFVMIYSFQFLQKRKEEKDGFGLNTFTLGVLKISFEPVAEWNETSFGSGRGGSRG